MTGVDRLLVVADAISAETTGCRVRDQIEFLLGIDAATSSWLLGLMLHAASDRVARTQGDRAVAPPEYDPHIVVAMLVGLELGVAAERCRTRETG